ncbi:unnamed protein product [Trichobilharzia regenti]|nr:unnamed protein product [Trichobilharzia regenti]
MKLFDVVENAWRIPLTKMMTKTPIVILLVGKINFLRIYI